MDSPTNECSIEFLSYLSLIPRNRGQTASGRQQGMAVGLFAAGAAWKVTEPVRTVSFISAPLGVVKVC